jgi:methylenetetrahydrofolate reductase (NADPH)
MTDSIERVLSGEARAAGSNAPPSSEARGMVTLARMASVETTWHDVHQLGACRTLIAPGTRVFASHLPGQTWRQSVATCMAIRRHGFEPVPHIPVRRLKDRADFANVISELVAAAGVSSVLLIAGDAPRPAGLFSSTLEALSTGVLGEHGIRRLFVAGHPEGHPQILDHELRRAERDKFEFASAHGLEVAFLTQFFFDAAPFLAWVRIMRSQGIDARIVAGLAGPARLTTLFKFALRCSVGPSIRALGSRPDLFAKLATERDPEPIIRGIVRADAEGGLGDIGIHLFSFGGLTRTCDWLHALAAR